jgi:hypothetical protein
LPGYSLADAVEQIGNEIERTISRQNGEDVGSLKGKTIRLRFVMKDIEGCFIVSALSQSP